MAKFKDDDFDLDKSLDLDFDDPFAPNPKDEKRGVIARVFGNAKAGARDAFTSPDTLRKITENILPPAYGRALSMADSAKAEMSDLHSIVQNELKPAMPIAKRLTEQHLGKVKDHLPKNIADKLAEFAKPEQVFEIKTDQQRDEESLKASLSEVFSVQMRAQAQADEKSSIEGGIRHAQILSANRTQLQLLSGINHSLRQVVASNDEITQRYQRRNLEIQTRQLFMMRDSLKLQVETTRRFNGFLEAITKNTAMPDILKQDLSHTATQTIRTKFIGGMHDSAAKLAGNIFGRAGTKLKAKAKEMAGAAAGALGMMDPSQNDGMPGLSTFDMVTQMAVKFAITKGGEAAGRKAVKLISKKWPGFDEWFEKMGGSIENLPYFINEWARSGTTQDGWKGSVISGVKDFLSPAKLNTTVNRRDLADINKVASFNNLTQRSITEIIPGWLQRIHHSVERISDPTASPLAYDFIRGQFDTESRVVGGIVKAAMSDDRAVASRRQLNDLVDSMVGGADLDSAVRNELLRELMWDSAQGNGFDLERYSDPLKASKYLSAGSKVILGRLINASGRSQKWKTDRIKDFHAMDIGASMPTATSDFFQHIGQGELLYKAGILSDRNADGEVDGLQHMDYANFTDRILNATGGAVKFAKKRAKPVGVLGKVGNFINGKKEPADDDLFVTPGGQPVLKGEHLLAGRYIDTSDGKPFYYWDDCHGAIHDNVLNATVADEDAMRRGFFDRTGKRVSFRLKSDSGKTNAYENLGNVGSVSSGQTRPAPVDDGVYDIIANGQVVMSAWMMRLGRYRDQLTGNAIYKPSDIAGPVVDEHGNVVVTARDIANVLTDSKGGSYAHLIERMRSNAQTTANTLNVGPDRSASARLGEYGNQDVGTLDATSGQLLEVNVEQLAALRTIAEMFAAYAEASSSRNAGEGGGKWGSMGFLDRIAWTGLKGIGTIAGGVGKGAWWWTKKVGGAVGAIGSVGVGAARGTGSFIGQRVSNAMRGMKDIYVNGKREPALTKQKINFGHYKDEKTGKKITRWRDITGPVIDVSTGEYVIDQEDFDRGIFVKGPAGLQRLMGGVVGGASTLLGAAARFYGNVAALPFKLANMGLKAATSTAKWLFEKQVDVYVKGEKTPRLKASKMKTRRYYNVGGKRPGWIVESYDDIHGEIKELAPGSSKPSKEDITVLHEEEIHEPGLCNRWGMKLATPFARLLGVAGNAAVRTLQGVGALFGGALKGYGKLFGGIMGIGGNTIGAILGAPFKMLGAVLNPFEKHGERQVQLLEGILKLLEDRMPATGPRKGSWQEQNMLKEKLEEEEKRQEEEEERESRWGLGSVMSKLGGFFGRGGSDDEDEDEDDDDGSLLSDAADAADIYDAVGDANERRRGRSGLRRGGGRWNRYRRNRRAKRLRRERAARASGRGGRAGRLGRIFGMGRGGAAANAARGAGAARTAGTAARSVGGLRSAGMAGAGLAAGGGLAAAAASTGGGLVGGLGGYHAADWVAGKAGLEEGSAGRTAVGVTGGVAGGVAGAALTAKVVGGTVAVLGAPVVGIGLAAAAAVGGLAYLGYKQYKYGRLTPIRRFRHMQYGVPDSGASTNEKIFKLEELLINHVGEKNGGLEIVSKGTNGKEISMEQVYEIAGVEKGWVFSRDDERIAFNRWYSNRFKPLFLSWVKELRAIAPNVNLMEAEEKLPADQMEQLLRKAWAFSPALYRYPDGPFGDPAVTSQSEIEDAFNLALKEIGKTPEEKNRSKAMGLMRTMGMLNPAGFVAVKLWDRHQRKKDEQRATEATAENIEKETGQALAATTGTVINTKGADSLLPSTLVRLGKLTATQAIRVRAYGLTNLDQDRVRALLATEQHVLKNVGVSSSGRVHFLLGADQVYANVAGLFGLTANSTEDRARWCQWFINRFQPTLAAYLSAVRAVNSSADFTTPERTLKPSELIQVAQAVMSAKTDTGDSVWSWKGSPWSSREQLSSDSNAVAGSLLVLKQKAEKETVREDAVTGQDAAVKKDRGVLGGMMDAMRRGASATSDWLLGSRENRNFVGRTVDGVMGGVRAVRNSLVSAYEAAKEGDLAGVGQAAVNLSTAGFSTFSATHGSMAPVVHPGGGSGGDINSLPTPPPNFEVSAIRKGDERAKIYKPLIVAVARMVGVDAATLMRMCALESSFHAGASASVGTATGLFQFVRGTWEDMLRKYGRMYGISMEAPRTDPRANALMGACYIKENAEGMARWIGRPVTEMDIYMAHFLGPGGYRSFCRAGDGEIGARVLPAAANNNRPSFYTGNRALTIGEIKQKIQARLARVNVDYPEAMAGLNAPSFSGVSSSVSSTAAATPVSSATAAAASPVTATGTRAVNATPTPVTGATGAIQAAVPQTGAVAAPAVAPRAAGGSMVASAATVPTGSSSVPTSDLPIVRLVREPSTDSGTFGRFTLPDGTVLHSLELPWKENAPQMSCIPVGSYRAEMRATRNFGNAYELKNVPGRSAILIHAGNFAGDVSKGMKANSQGCILLGLGRNEQNGQKSITSSRGAMETFLAKMAGRPFLLVVTGSNGIANDVSTAVRSPTETSIPAVTPAPSIQSVRSLEATAASQRQADAEQQAAATRAAEARAAAQRQAAAQQISNQRNEEARMSGVTEILTRSYETQRKIETNTADAVSLLRQLLRQPGIAEKPTATPAPAPAPASTPASPRPLGQRRDAPVSVRYEQ